jgi:hypothetical protein
MLGWMAPVSAWGLVVWLVKRTPEVLMFGAWNNWGVALAVCVVIDLLTGMGANARATARASRRARERQP